MKCFFRGGSRRRWLIGRGNHARRPQEEFLVQLLIMYGILIYLCIRSVCVCERCVLDKHSFDGTIQTHVYILPIRFTNGKKNNNTMKRWSGRERQTCLSWNMFSIYFIGTRVFWISHIRPAKRKHSNRVYYVYACSAPIITMIYSAIVFHIRILYYTSIVYSVYDAPAGLVSCISYIGAYYFRQRLL